ncbi:MAG: deoxyribodipyrimidine photo-lyase [Pseudorhodobacter sp.]|nr:deoxyribodipyrimidine photo-lyase [Rhizobacter sp.]
MTNRSLVWFKRDLRSRDHAPLVEAQNRGTALALFVIEPEWLGSDECDPQHVAFTLGCLSELRADLAALGLPLWVHVGDAVSALQGVHAQFAFTELFSHEETGSGWTYTRDLAVAAWCKPRGVVWHEWSQTGVVRRLKSRLGWARQWSVRMDAAPALLQGGFKAPEGALALHNLPDLPQLKQLGVAAPTQKTQAAGELAAGQTLESFLHARGRDYRRAMSSPLSAADSCSRLSAHLAFGSISMRSVHHAAEAAIVRARSQGDAHQAQALRSFSSRLRWHCHFMQKLEDQPSIEFRNFARVCDSLRPGDAGNFTAPSERDQFNFEAWCTGATGFPMVDACMRSLRATGWLNFRMRAMLVSFAPYHLWLHWRETGVFLARQFLDFEPGIHWSQMQMQSGTTGINTLRIYSPTKQAADQDPTGEFVRRWVPEFGTAAYPAPIVEERAAMKHAKDRMYSLRATPEAKAQADEVQQKHGSRKSGLTPTVGKRTAVKKVAPASTQQDLFGD